MAKQISLTYFVNDIPRGVLADGLISFLASLASNTPMANFDVSHYMGTKPRSQSSGEFGDFQALVEDATVKNSLLDDELSVAIITFKDIPRWFRNRELDVDPYAFPKKTRLGTIWKGVDLKMKDQEGRTAFLRAVIDGNLKLAETLAEYEETDVNATDNQGMTALHWACKNGLADLTEFCLSLPGLDLSVKSKRGQTGFDVAYREALWEDNDVIPALFYRNMFEMEEYDPDNALLRLLTLTTDSQGKTLFPQEALFSPSRNGNLALVQVLLKNMVLTGPIVTNKYRQTALHMAAVGGHTAIVTLLVSTKYFDINAATRDGYTALHYAATGGHNETVIVLASHGINLHTKNTNGHTAVELASQNDHQSTVRLLIELGANMIVKVPEKKAEHPEAATPLITERKTSIEINVSGNTHPAESNGHIVATTRKEIVAGSPSIGKTPRRRSSVREDETRTGTAGLSHASPTISRVEVEVIPLDEKVNTVTTTIVTESSHASPKIGEKPLREPNSIHSESSASTSEVRVGVIPLDEKVNTVTTTIVTESSHASPKIGGKPLREPSSVHSESSASTSGVGVGVIPLDEKVNTVTTTIVTESSHASPKIGGKPLREPSSVHSESSASTSGVGVGVIPLDEKVNTVTTTIVTESSHASPKIGGKPLREPSSVHSESSASTSGVGVGVIPLDEKVNTVTTTIVTESPHASPKIGGKHRRPKSVRSASSVSISKEEDKEPTWHGTIMTVVPPSTAPFELNLDEEPTRPAGRIKTTKEKIFTEVPGSSPVIQQKTPRRPSVSESSVSTTEDEYSGDNISRMTSFEGSPFIQQKQRRGSLARRRVSIADKPTTGGKVGPTVKEIGYGSSRTGRRTPPGKVAEIVTSLEKQGEGGLGTTTRRSSGRTDSPIKTPRQIVRRRYKETKTSRTYEEEHIEEGGQEDAKTRMEKLLVRHNHQVNGRDDQGLMPLHEAIFSQDIDVVGLLLDNGADIEERLYTWITPVEIAEQKGNEELLELLIERGARPVEDSWREREKQPALTLEYISSAMISQRGVSSQLMIESGMHSGQQAGAETSQSMEVVCCSCMRSRSLGGSISQGGTKITGSHHRVKNSTHQLDFTNPSYSPRPKGYVHQEALTGSPFNVSLEGFTHPSYGVEDGLHLFPGSSGTHSQTLRDHALPEDGTPLEITTSISDLDIAPRVDDTHLPGVLAPPDKKLDDWEHEQEITYDDNDDDVVQHNGWTSLAPEPGHEEEEYPEEAYEDEYGAGNNDYEEGYDDGGGYPEHEQETIHYNDNDDDAMQETAHDNVNDNDVVKDTAHDNVNDDVTSQTTTLLAGKNGSHGVGYDAVKDKTHNNVNDNDVVKDITHDNVNGGDVVGGTTHDNDDDNDDNDEDDVNRREPLGRGMSPEPEHEEEEYPGVYQDEYGAGNNDYEEGYDDGGGYPEHEQETIHYNDNDDDAVQETTHDNVNDNGTVKDTTHDNVNGGDVVGGTTHDNDDDDDAVKDTAHDDDDDNDEDDVNSREPLGRSMSPEPEPELEEEEYPEEAYEDEYGGGGDDYEENYDDAGYEYNDEY